MIRRMMRYGGVLCVLAVGACTPATEDTVSDTAQQAPDLVSSVPLEVSLNAVMVGLVDHASHSIWEAATTEHAPKTDKDWEEVEHHALQIAAAGSVISKAGTGGSDAVWVKTPDWQRYAKELADTGVAAWDAAKKKDMQAVTDVGDRLVMTCEGCHELYKGELPTEGILHPH